LPERFLFGLVHCRNTYLKGRQYNIVSESDELELIKQQKDVNMVKYQIGRSAVTGRFVSVRAAQNKPRTHVVETIKKK